MNEIPDIVKELREKEINYKTPDIVKELKELEKYGALESKSFDINNNSNNHSKTIFVNNEKTETLKIDFGKQNELSSIST